MLTTGHERQVDDPQGSQATPKRKRMDVPPLQMCLFETAVMVLGGSSVLEIPASCVPEALS